MSTKIVIKYIVIPTQLPLKHIQDLWEVEANRCDFFPLPKPKK